MKQFIELTAEKFADIYTDEAFRNDVAFAHQYADKNSVVLGRKTCSYPIEYKVTDEQIKLAEIERQRAKKQTVKDNKGKLMFVGMGCTYEPRYKDDVCNHRIRTSFTNAEGKKYFIELGTGNGHQMRCDHSVDRDLEYEYEEIVANLRKERDSVKRYSDEWDELCLQIDKYTKQVYYNYQGLEHKGDLPKYTLQNVLNLVNKYFNCNFKEIVIDNYNVSTEDYTSVSPKHKAAPAN
jgi:hypothetical protein